MFAFINECEYDVTMISSLELTLSLSLPEYYTWNYILTSEHQLIGTESWLINLKVVNIHRITKSIFKFILDFSCGTGFNIIKWRLAQNDIMNLMVHFWANKTMSISLSSLSYLCIVTMCQSYRLRSFPKMGYGIADLSQSPKPFNLRRIFLKDFTDSNQRG